MLKFYAGAIHINNITRYFVLHSSKVIHSIKVINSSKLIHSSYHLILNRNGIMLNILKGSY
jgi:hypothetical protein